MDYTKHIQKAQEAARRRNYDFAIELFQQLLEIDPDVGEARAGLRSALKKRHDTQRGGKLFGKLKGAGPLAVAKGLAKAGKHDSAARSFESYLATAPLDEEANLLLGISLEGAGHFKSALAVYEFVAQIAPKNPEGLKRAGAMVAKAGNVPQALEYYERALEIDPRDRDAIKARKDLAAEAALSGARYEEVGHSREQVKDRQEVQRLERSKRLHLTDEELREELERLEERFGEDPSSVEVMTQLADVHEKLKDPEAALDMAERALSYDKASQSLEERVGRLRVKTLKLAIRRADKAGDTAEADRLEAKLSQFEVDQLRRRLELSPGDALARLELGRTLLRQGDLDGAAGELQRAASDPRCKREALFLLARCFHGKGFLDLARREYQRALDEHADLDERAREILYHLGAIEEAEGNLAEARSCYARIYAVDIAFRDVAAKMESLS